jgi:hypothetical protein
LELWEYNAYLTSYNSRKDSVVNAILTGYYSAYYTNGGRKTKNPNELIKKLYAEKQSLAEGLKDIERLKEAEKRKE